MALFLQLLTPEEVLDLSAEELRILRTAFYHTLYNNMLIKRQLTDTISETLAVIRARREGSPPG
jgi:hypothetical protein